MSGFVEDLFLWQLERERLHTCHGLSYAFCNIVLLFDVTVERASWGPKGRKISCFVALDGFLGAFALFK